MQADIAIFAFSTMVIGLENGRKLDFLELCVKKGSLLAKRTPNQDFSPSFMFACLGGSGRSVPQ